MLKQSILTLMSFFPLSKVQSDLPNSEEIYAQLLADLKIHHLNNFIPSKMQHSI